MLALAAIFSAKLNRLCNFGKGDYEKYFCKLKTIVNLAQLFRRICSLKKKSLRTADDTRRTKTDPATHLEPLAQVSLNS